MHERKCMYGRQDLSHNVHSDIYRTLQPPEDFFFFIEVEDRDMNIRRDYVKKNGKIINIHIILPQHKHYTHTHTHIHRDIIISTRGRNRARTHIQSHTRTHTHTYSL